MKRILLFTILMCTFLMAAQVGIGTTSPTAQLEIDTSGSSLPPLELNPQTNPVGTAAGQLAVIGDQLYLYDSVRTKWLTVASATFNFGHEGGLNNEELEYAGDIENSGPNMAYDGTIVYATLNSSGGNPVKGITLSIYNEERILQSTHAVNLIGGRRVLSDFDVDFSAGDYFIVSVDDDLGGDVNDLSMVLWTKGRK